MHVIAEATIYRCLKNQNIYFLTDRRILGFHREVYFK